MSRAKTQVISLSDQASTTVGIQINIDVSIGTLQVHFYKQYKINPLQKYETYEVILFVFIYQHTKYMKVN